jgi:hypothetical protein
MTEIDAHADIDMIWRENELTIRVPLAGEVTQEWARRYLRLAERKGIPARAEDAPGRAWLVITLPASADRSEVLETLEAAREPIAKADAAEEASPDHDREIAAAVREWWAKQRN